jgi:hypothetical protein
MSRDVRIHLSHGSGQTELMLHHSNNHTLPFLLKGLHKMWRYLKKGCLLSLGLQLKVVPSIKFQLLEKDKSPNMSLLMHICFTDQYSQIVSSCFNPIRRSRVGWSRHVVFSSSWLPSNHNRTIYNFTIFSQMINFLQYMLVFVLIISEILVVSLVCLTHMAQANEKKWLMEHRSVFI